MDARGWCSLALALLVVLAGCSAPVSLGEEEDDRSDGDGSDGDGSMVDLPGGPGTADRPTDSGPTPTPAGTPPLDDDVTVENGNLGVDEDLLFARVERMLGEDIEPEPVYVRDLSGGKGSTSAFTPLHRMLGVGAVQLDPDQPAGLTQASGEIYFDPRDATVEAVERRLVHEFVHVVQFKEAWVDPPGAYDVELTRDFVLAWRAVAEGGAVYVADAYIERHMATGQTQSELLAAQYERGDPDGTRIVLAPYHFGFQYVRAQVDSPRDLESVYDTIPKTTEQVLHNETPASEPPMDLTVDVETGGTFDGVRSDRKGEMLVRAVLRAELDRERAARAAAGWGTDRWRSFTNGYNDRWSLAWVTRWDTERDADEFERALRTFVDRREAETDATFRVVRLSDGVVVLLAGDEAFVEGASVRGSGDRVSITVDASSTATRLGVGVGGRVDTTARARSATPTA